MHSQSVFCCVCVCWSGSDIGLNRLLVAVSLCSVSVVRVCVCLDPISGFNRICSCCYKSLPVDEFMRVYSQHCVGRQLMWPVSHI